MQIQTYRVTVAAFMLASTNTYSNTPPSSVESCLLQRIQSANASTTVAQLREQCAAATRSQDHTLTTTEIEADNTPASDNAIARRITREWRNRDHSYVITPHNPNFFLPFTHNTKPNVEPFLELDPDAEVDKNEAMIQVSVKFPVAIDLWDSNTDLMVAYTNRAWWQIYNDEFSKPFRETNYEPELFLRHYTLNENKSWYVPEFFDFGYIHQSNGRSEPLSRSWDRILSSAAYQLNPNLSLLLRAWYRLPENDDDNELAGEYRYLGYGDARFVYTHNKHTFTMMARPGTEEISVEATWSYPIAKHIRLMVYYYNGYAENLLDYNKKTERIGIGFSISDYLMN
ncbi:MAG: phospholipase A [Parahaliea sp.]